MNDLKKRTWAEISLDNIIYNYRTIKASVAAGTKFLGVVKANAYGHGAVPVARALEKNGADYLAVACLDEAVELREAGIRLPILILGHTPVCYTEALIQNNITQACGSTEAAEGYSAEAVRLGAELKIHIKVDSGMSRLGFVCADEHLETAVAEISRAVRLPGLAAEGIFTHFAVSDEEGESHEAYTREQFSRFMAVIHGIEAGGFRFKIRHCANSGATLNYPEMHLDMIRPGILLYGYGDDANKLGLKPCMNFKTTVAAIKHYDPGTTVSYGRRFETERETRMGVICAGYADGLFRALSNQVSFMTKDGAAPQRGRICMDMCMVDLTDLPNVTEGDVVELFGSRNDLNILAKTAGTITYELLCAVSRRVPRIYGD